MNANRWILVIFMAVTLTACASPGASGTATAAPAGEKAAELPPSEDDPNRVVCRREHVVGSNFTRRVCRTVKQIEEERLASQQKLEQERTRMLQKALPPPRGN